ncbi:MAG: hypothetical protein JNK72_12380 [Myxococcales bacterium]|nr:hypothetical protein [Myxococcales bacterium]
MEIVIERGKTVPFESLPPKSVALDGYVLGPRIDAERERFSFDHHGDCVRHATRSSAEQVHDAIALGFRPRGLTIFLNDVDLDTALAVWLLRHVERAGEPLVNRLVSVAGLLDAHSGAFPLSGEMPTVVEWLSEPETAARACGSYFELDNEGLRALLDEVGRRISVYADGASHAYTSNFKIDNRYKVLKSGTGWSMVESLGIRAHARLFAEGHDRVVIHTLLRDGSHGYTVAKRSEFVKGFPVPKILAALAAREPGWGGGSTVGGAPRNADGSRSDLDPDAVFQIIESVVLSCPCDERSNGLTHSQRGPKLPAA